MQVKTFKTIELAIKQIREIEAWLSVQAENMYDPEDPNADEIGQVWVISLSPHKNADKLYLCIDGCFRS